MELFNEWIEKIQGWVWGTPLIVLIIAVGILLTVRLRLIQVRHLPKACLLYTSPSIQKAGKGSEKAAISTLMDKLCYNKKMEQRGGLA